MREHVMVGIGDRREDVWNGDCHNVRTHVPSVTAVNRHEPTESRLRHPEDMD